MFNAQILLMEEWLYFDIPTSNFFPAGVWNYICAELQDNWFVT